MGEVKLPSISVIIPNYNGADLLKKNLPSIFSALNNVKCDYEVIIPDDSSTDDSVGFLAKEYPEIIVLKGSVNEGFSKNINRGIFKASNDLMLLLNSDIELSENYLSNQLGYFLREDTFGVAGKIVDDNDKIAEACKYPLKSIFKINHLDNIDFDSKGKDIYTYYLSGANALIDRKKLVTLGGFNELYSPFYNEDLDLSLRAWECGWKCYYENNATCKHHISATINKYNSKFYISTINTRNKLYLHYFHLDGLRLFIWGFTTLVSLLIRWLIGHFYYYSAAKLFLQNFKLVSSQKQNFRNMANADYQFAPLPLIKKRIRQSLDFKTKI